MYKSLFSGTSNLPSVISLLLFEILTLTHECLILWQHQIGLDLIKLTLVWLSTEHFKSSHLHLWHQVSGALIITCLLLLGQIIDRLNFFLQPKRLYAATWPVSLHSYWRQLSFIWHFNSQQWQQAWYHIPTPPITGYLPKYLYQSSLITILC